MNYIKFIFALTVFLFFSSELLLTNGTKPPPSASFGLDWITL